MRISTIALTGILSTTLFAATNMKEISMQFSATDWVSTQKATVLLGIDANLTPAQMKPFHQHMKDTLEKIAKSDWHVTSYTRNPTNTGLEHIHINAQTRIEMPALSGIRAKAEGLNTPGVQYHIDNIGFHPSNAERESVYAQLREALYARTKSELKQIRVQFPDIPFEIEKITMNASWPRPGLLRMNVVNKAQEIQSPQQQVSERAEMHASVVFGARE